MSDTLLPDLRKEAGEISTRLAEIASVAEADQKRSLTAEENTEWESKAARLRTINTQIDVLQAASDRADADKVRTEALETANRTYGSQARVVKEEGPYTPRSAANHGPSYFRDLIHAKKGDRAAQERLEANNKHVDTYKVRDAGLSTASGVGGEFVPPLWLEQEFVPLARAGRVTVDLFTKDDLPTGTDSINIPKVSTGTAVATQGYPTGGQNTAIQTTDLTTSSISSGVFTVAGGQTVAMQLIEQSPVNIDKVVLSDLALAYGIQVDQYGVAGAGGSTAPQGLLTLSGTNTITYTDATPSLVGSTGSSGPANMYTAIAAGISQIQRKRFVRPDYISMHPELWYWMLTQLDGNKRPVVLENSYGPWNAVGAQAGLAPEGLVGSVLGLPVVTDANLPTNLGVGTNQTPIIVGLFKDAWLWEGSLKAEAFEQTYAQNLSLFLRLYNYVSVQAARYPQSFSIILGTGMIAPSGF